MRKFIRLLVVMFTLSVTYPVSADVAPPAYPPGFNPAPGSEQTQVRMEAETVRMNILEETGGDELGVAEVNAIFTMKNMGTAAESMAVRFPAGAGNGWFGVAEIQDIAVKVDGRTVNLRSISGEDPNGFEEAVPWVEFNVDFPAGKEVMIEVAYTLEATGEYPYVWFEYIFSTGAGWKGTIGSADLIVTFPYEVDEIFLLPCIDNSYGCTRPGGLIDGNTITWQFRDFEPETTDNFVISMAAPSLWTQVLEETARVAAEPSDGEAWGRLGKHYKSLIFSPHGRRGFRSWLFLADPGVERLFQLCDEAYNNAITLLPEDAQWHAGYADLLGYYAEYAGYEGVATLPLKINALEEMHLALELAPDDEVVNNIALDLSWLMYEGIVETEDGYDFPWLTQTPVATATEINPIIFTPTPESRMVSTSTSNPVQQASPTSVPVVVTALPEGASGGKVKTPLCGGALLIPFAMMAGVKLWQTRGIKRSG